MAESTMDKSSLPLVSIAIITYNHEKFIGEALNSVLGQDYENIEIVVADDGSKDRTPEILRKFERDNPGKLRLILSERNEGITVNSNKAHFACRGKYVAWLGGDDLMLPGKIRKQVKFLEDHPDYYIVYHNLEIFRSETGEILQLFNYRKDKHQGEVELLIKYGTFNGACSTMLRRDKAPLYGFDTELPVASDWFYWIETLRNGGKIGYIDEVLGRYRRHSANVTNKDSEFISQGILDHFKTLEKVRSYEKNYSKEIKFRLSNLYNIIRNNDYGPLLRKSLSANIFNIKSWIYFIVYYATFKRVKL
jgi:glycosyltransferase involved in cell wall biosynthesis